MTFSQLKDLLLGTPDSQGQAFPLGTPENLRPQCEQFVVEALIEIQRNVECWQAGHTDVFPACVVLVQNGTSVITKPDGRIDRVYTIETKADGSGWDRPIGYDPVELRVLRRWMARFRSSLRYPSKFVSPPGQEGFRASSAADNSPLGRAMAGMWSIDARTSRLIVGPWLQSNESLVVEWTGIKRCWNDSDLVSDNPDFVRLVKLWVLQEYGRFWSSQDLSIRVDTWATAQADAIITCRESRQMPTEGVSVEERSEQADYYAVEAPAVPEPAKTSTRICFVGDTGANDADSQAVSAVVVQQAPDLVVLLGDAIFPPNTPAQALQPYADLLDAGRVVVALGNYDLDLNHGSDVSAYVRNPGNGRYFTISIGPVEVFVVNSGINTSGESVEDDGNYLGSSQWSAIQAMILRSCATWKFVALHHAPYTSGVQYWPGVSQVRWVSDLEVHAIVAAHANGYERGTWRGRRHLVVGTGGRPVHPFITPPMAGSEFQVSSLGCLVLEADKTSAR